MKNALLIYSGGLDSTTLLHDFKEDIAVAVTFLYGSKHNTRELQAAVMNCALLGIEHLIIDIEDIGYHLKSDLLKSGGEIPEGHYEDESMKKTVVPFRNGIMLSIATGIAESRRLTKVMIANHAGDHAIYPDCRANFISAMDSAIFFGTSDDNKVMLLAPYTRSTKRQIAEIGEGIGVDFTKTWSCYKGGELHCGKCGTCVERKEALQGFDPTQYEA